MGASHAMDLRLRVKELPLNLRQGRKPVRKAKVIELPVRRRKTKPKTLSPRQQENIIIEHRAKARKLGRSILRKWHARLDLEEVDSIVDLSLCEAVRRFNPTKGASFMTFLYYHLRGNLIRAVTTAATANSIPLPDPEISEVQAHESNQRNPYHAASAIEVAEALCGHDHPLPDELLFKKELVDLSQKACEKLDALEKQVINGVYLEEKQLIDVAAALGYSRCHISRVKRRALETLFNELKYDSSQHFVNADDEVEAHARIGRRIARRSNHRRRLRAGTKTAYVAERSDVLRAVC